MNAKRILFPTDFSRTGDAAMSMATTLARDTGATMLILHVEEPPLAYGAGEMYYGLPEPDVAELKKMLQKVLPTDPDVSYEHHLITGDPASAIPKFAQEQSVDLIVMGTHGRTGFTRLLMGSVAEAIVRRAPCPVMTYKHHEEATAETN